MNHLIQKFYRSWVARLMLIWISLSLIAADDPPPPAPSLPTNIYLPVISVHQSNRLVNLPYFSDPQITSTRFKEMAILWFGRVTPSENYTDVRIAYNNTEIWVYLAVFDRRLWYDNSPVADDLPNWDSASLFLDLAATPSGRPGPQSFQFLAQFTPFPNADQRLNHQRALKGNGSTWQPASLEFSTISGWRGDAANNDTDDRGWAMTFIIPYSSLGLSPGSPPPAGTLWRLGLQVMDRDGSAGAMMPIHFWPEDFSASDPTSWGLARFGLPAYTPMPSSPGGTIQVRHRLNGTVVQDASAGGYAVCGEGTDFFSEWGDKTERYYNQEGADYNVQNQADVADWPCFSKIYLRFPLTAIPPGKVIRQARLYLHQFGQAGASGQAVASIIQVLTVSPDWNDLSLTWNNAPLAEENVGLARVDPLSTFPGWPGVRREWDLSYAVAQAYLDGLDQINLALYSADSAYHSGKYFVSSDTGDWNAEGRPTLEIIWGNP
jgi:hypothetical protein